MILLVEILMTLNYRVSLKYLENLVYIISVVLEDHLNYLAISCSQN